MNARTWAVAVLALVGCSGRQHLWETRGVAYDKSFVAQQGPRPAAGARRAPPAAGLDSQEASIIAEGYRASLAPKGSRADQQQQPVLIVAPPGQAQPQYMLPPPSVPKE